MLLVILGHERRRLIGFGVTAHPSAEWIARQVTEAFPWDEAPRYLIRDRDGAFSPAYTRRIRAMGNPRSSDRRSVTLAKRTRRAADRLDSPRVHGPHGGVERGASASHPPFIRYLLQSSADSPLLEQGRTGRSKRSAHRANYRASAPRRNTSSIRSDLIFGNDNLRQHRTCHEPLYLRTKGCEVILHQQGHEPPFAG